MKKLTKLLYILLILAMLVLPAWGCSAIMCTTTPALTVASTAPDSSITTPVVRTNPSASTTSIVSESPSTNITPVYPAALPDYFTIAVIPDTQIYSRDSSKIFQGMTNWIVANKVRQNIIFTAHEGDIVDDVYDWNQWANAKTAMDVLKTGGIPYSVLPGNHDSGQYPYKVYDLTNYNYFFPYSDFSGNSWFGGSYPANTVTNSYDLITIHELNFIIMNIEYAPLAVGDSVGVYAWANKVLDTYSNYKAIIVTHAFLYTDGTELNPGAEDLFNGMVAQHSNIFAILCGHYWDAQHIIKTGINGNRIDVMMFDRQELQNGGDGDIRLYRFYPVLNTIEVHTYSTLFSTELTDANNRFDIPYQLYGLTGIMNPYNFSCDMGKDYLSCIEEKTVFYNRSNSEPTIDS